MSNYVDVLLAYILGFIVSDGSVIVDEPRGIGKIKLTTSDSNIVSEFEKAIRSYYGSARSVNIIRTPKRGAIDIFLHDLNHEKLIN